MEQNFTMVFLFVVCKKSGGFPDHFCDCIVLYKKVCSFSINCVQLIYHSLTSHLFTFLISQPNLIRQVVLLSRLQKQSTLIPAAPHFHKPSRLKVSAHRWPIKLFSILSKMYFFSEVCQYLLKPFAPSVLSQFTRQTFVRISPCSFRFFICLFVELLGIGQDPLVPMSYYGSNSSSSPHSYRSYGSKPNTGPPTAPRPNPPPQNGYYQVS